MALTDKLKAIANAIRSKTGETAEMTLDEMATAIEGISVGAETKMATVTISYNKLSTLSGLSMTSPVVKYVSEDGTTISSITLSASAPSVISVPVGSLICVYLQGSISSTASSTSFTLTVSALATNGVTSSPIMSTISYTSGNRIYRKCVHAVLVTEETASFTAQVS